MSPALLIINGKAAASPELREAVLSQRKAGWELAVRVTWEHGDATRYANEACELGMASVIAVGGDGTVNEVAAALASRGEDAQALPSLGVLPFGTANDFAGACGIPLEAGAALALVRDAVARPIDIGRVRLRESGETRYFINLATGGVGAEVTTATSDDLKRVLGSAAYAITGLSRFHALQSLSLEVHGETAGGERFAWLGDSLALGIGNGVQAGGGHRLCPDARIDDGLLDLAILPTPPEGEWLAALGELLSGGAEAVHASMTRARLRSLRLQTGRRIQLNLDGEPVQGDDFRIDILPARLRLHCPPDCQLLSKGDSAAA